MNDDHPFAAIAGTWRGRGEGSYPTIEPFAYTEELVIEPVPGRPVAHWRSRTRDAATSEPRHAESGFLRHTPTGIEFVVAHGFGVVETSSGALATGAGGPTGTTLTLTLSSQALHGTPTAKQVDHVDRRYDFNEDRTTVAYTMAMSAVGQPLTHHLQAQLDKSP